MYIWVMKTKNKQKRDWLVQQSGSSILLLLLIMVVLDVGLEHMLKGHESWVTVNLFWTLGSCLNQTIPEKKTQRKRQRQQKHDMRPQTDSIMKGVTRHLKALV